ncbi:hypothetical protein BS17DRAFT_661921, partial [Gyrodon lividus]
TIRLPEVQLLCNVKTRWDSTYYMINCLHALRQVVSYFLDAPCNTNIADHKMLPLGWEVLQDMEVVLEV